MPPPTLHFASLADRADQWIDCAIELQPHHQRGRSLRLRWPRWVPGSYTLRDPLRLARTFAARDAEGRPLRLQRHGASEVRIRCPADVAWPVHVTWSLLCNELTVRSNHVDTTHAHLVPPFLWPDLILDGDRTHDGPTETWLLVPTAWHVASQATPIDAVPPYSSDAPHGGRAAAGAGSATTTERHPLRHAASPLTASLPGHRWAGLASPDRDEHFDSVIEANANAPLWFTVGHVEHELMLWDEGGLPWSEAAATAFITAATGIVEQQWAIFGDMPWSRYTTILHLTDTARGGLEHLRSQSDQMPRACLAYPEGKPFEDVVGLFAHEHIHAWNVKRLRPASLVDIDLGHMVHLDLLWWFEGVTSWLGDLSCLRSGAWSEAAWRREHETMLDRHWTERGWEHQPLATSSHEAWTQLYQPHARSREFQVSYYLEGQLAALCLDAELRRRTRGEVGLDDVARLLWKRHGLDSPALERLGIDEADIRKAFRDASGGKRLGAMLDRLIHGTGTLPLDEAWSYDGLRAEAKPAKEDAPPPGWLGIDLRRQQGRLEVSRVRSHGPAGGVLRPGDEVLGVDGQRVRTTEALTQVLIGRADASVELTIARGGAITTVDVDVGARPDDPVKLVGSTNARFAAMAAARPVPE